MNPLALVLFLAALTVSKLDGAKTTDDVVIKAIKAGDKEALLDFLSNGTDINQCLTLWRTFQLTPLSLAIKEKKEEIALLLIEKGANLTKKCDDEKCTTPLTFAIRTNSTRLVKALLNKGVEIDPLSLAEAFRYDLKLADLFLQKGFDFKKQFGDCLPVLTVAAKHGIVNLTKLAIEKGADIEHESDLGYTALNYACWGLCQTRIFKEVEKCALVLIEAGADIHNMNKMESTPIIFASSHNSTIVVEKLIEKGADVNDIDLRGHTPWSVAHQKGYKYMEKLLLDKGADVLKGETRRNSTLQ